MFEYIWKVIDSKTNFLFCYLSELLATILKRSILNYNKTSQRIWLQTKGSIIAEARLILNNRNGNHSIDPKKNYISVGRCA